MQAHLDAVIQKKDDLLLVYVLQHLATNSPLYIFAFQDADEKAEKMMAKMTAFQKTGEDDFKSQAVKMAEIKAERDHLCKQLDVKE
ncbi:hypothetical protein C0993_009139, partial [Termitomyces sp. T159_Od127]